MKLLLSITHKTEPWNRKPYRAVLTMEDDDTGVSQYCWSGRFKTLERAEAALEREADDWEKFFTPAEQVLKKERFL